VIPPEAQVSQLFILMIKRAKICSPENAQHCDPFGTFESVLIAVTHSSRCDQDGSPSEDQADIGISVNFSELMILGDDLKLFQRSRRKENKGAFRIRPPGWTIAEMDAGLAFFTASSRASLTSPRFEVLTVVVGNALPSRLGNTSLEVDLTT
jgi:hypothetical protein